MYNNSGDIYLVVPTAEVYIVAFLLYLAVPKSDSLT